MESGVKLTIAYSILRRRVIGFSLILFTVSAVMLYSGTIGSFHPVEVAISETIEGSMLDIIATIQFDSDWNYGKQMEFEQGLEQLQSIARVDTFLTMNGFEALEAPLRVSSLVGIDSSDPAVWLSTDRCMIHQLAENQTILDDFYDDDFNVEDVIHLVVRNDSAVQEVSLTVAGFMSFKSIISDNDRGQLLPASHILGPDELSFALVDMSQTLLKMIEEEQIAPDVYLSIEIDNSYLVGSDVSYLNQRIITVENRVAQNITYPLSVSRIDSILRSKLTLISESLVYLNYWSITVWLFIVLLTYTITWYSINSTMFGNRESLSRLIQRGIDRELIASSIRYTNCILSFIGCILGYVFSQLLIKGLFPESALHTANLSQHVMLFFLTLIVLVTVAQLVSRSSMALILEKDAKEDSDTISNLYRFAGNRFVEYTGSFLLVYMTIVIIVQRSPFELLNLTSGSSLLVFALGTLLAYLEVILTFSGDILFVIAASLLLLHLLDGFAEGVSSMARHAGMLCEAGTRAISEAMRKNPAPFVILILVSSIFTTSAIQYSSSYDIAYRRAQFYVGADVSITLEQNTDPTGVIEYLSVNKSLNRISVEHQLYAQISEQRTRIRLIESQSWTNVAYFEDSWFSDNPINLVSNMGQGELILSDRMAQILGIGIGDTMNITLSSSRNVSMKIVGLLYLASTSYATALMSAGNLYHFINQTTIESRILISSEDGKIISESQELQGMFPEISGIVCADMDVLPTEERVLLVGRINLAGFLLYFSTFISHSLFLILSWYFVINKSEEVKTLRKRGVSKLKTLSFVFFGVFFWFVLVIGLGMTASFIAYTGTTIFRNAYFSNPVTEYVMIDLSLGLVFLSLLATCILGGIIASTMLMRKEGTSG